MRWMILVVVVVGTMLAVSSYLEKMKTVELDGIKLCVPKEYAAHQMPIWLNYIKKDLDNSYQDFLFYIPPEELRANIVTYKPDTYLIKGERRYTDKGVIVTNVSAITGKSAAQERVIELVQTGKAQFEKSVIPNLIKVPHYESKREWSLIRSRELPDNLDTRSIHKWIAAYCSSNGVDERYTCHIQRIFGNLNYEVSIPDLNLENMGKIEQLIEGMLSKWQDDCKNEP